MRHDHHYTLDEARDLRDWVGERDKRRSKKDKDEPPKRTGGDDMLDRLGY